MKFKEGDKVRVKKNSRYEQGRWASRQGIVIGIARNTPYPYQVKLEKGATRIFRGSELEAIE